VKGSGTAGKVDVSITSLVSGKVLYGNR
jgi:hypothetical protein